MKILNYVFLNAHMMINLYILIITNNQYNASKNVKMINNIYNKDTVNQHVLMNMLNH